MQTCLMSHIDLISSRLYKNYLLITNKKTHAHINVQSWLSICEQYKL